MRKLNVLSNREYLEGFFLPYLRKEYERQENVIGLLDINLIDTYLGNDSGFGVGQAYYLNSREFIPALASQSPNRIEEFLDSESFKLHKSIFIDLRKLSVSLATWKTDKNNFFITDYLRSIWSEALYSALVNTEIFWKADRKEFALNIFRNFNEASKIFQKYGYDKSKKEMEHQQPAWWKGFESYLYILVHIKGKLTFSPLCLQFEIESLG